MTNLLDSLTQDIREKILVAKINGEEYTEPQSEGVDFETMCDVCGDHNSSYVFYDTRGVKYQICYWCHEIYYDNDDAIGILPIRDPT